MIVDILPLPYRKWYDEIDTVCAGFNVSNYRTDDDVIMFGRKYPLPDRCFKYKIIDSMEYGLVERVVLSLQPINLNNLRSKDNRSVDLYPISTKYFTYGNMTNQVKVFKFAKALDALLIYTSGTSIIPMTRKSLDTITEYAFKNEYWDIVNEVEDHLYWNWETINGLCIHDDLSKKHMFLNTSIVQDAIQLECGWYRNFGGSYHSLSTIIESITAHSVFTIHDNDYFSLTCLNDATIPSDHLRSYLSNSYKSHKYRNTVIDVNPFKNTKAFKIPEMLKETFHDVFNYLDQSIYTDLSLDMSKTQCNVNYLGNRYMKVIGYRSFLSNLRRLFKKVFVLEEHIVKISIEKTWMEELFITLYFDNDTSYNIYLDLVLYTLGSHAILED